MEITEAVVTVLIVAMVLGIPFAGLTLPCLVDAFSIFLVRQYVLALPAELEDAARVDGASELRIFATIVLPLLRPALAVVAINGFPPNWNPFRFPVFSPTAAFPISWPILGERPTLLRVIAFGLAFGGVTVILGGHGFSITQEKLLGFIMVLVGSFAFALGAVLSKRYPLPLPPMTSAAWQVGLGCLPVGLVGFAIETSDIGAVTTLVTRAGRPDEPITAGPWASTMRYRPPAS